VSAIRSYHRNGVARFCFQATKLEAKVRPQHFERRAQLVSAIAKGCQWLDDVVSGRMTTVAELCARENCSARQVNMTISLAFLSPNLVKAAIEGRLPRGIGIERLRDLPADGASNSRSSGSTRNSLGLYLKIPIQSSNRSPPGAGNGSLRPRDRTPKITAEAP
jgi:hypothetical protein